MNTDCRAFNVMEEPIIRVELTSRVMERSTLPQVFAALLADRVETWPALRPHQAPAWHAFLVQIAAMGLEALGWTEPPGDDEAGWSEVLRALTPDWPADDPWCLVTPPRCPALLQAPVPETVLRTYEKEYKHLVLAPDALDMLATAKNHDLKAERMRHAAPEDWLFALVSLQTQEGVMGRGNYGIARMNSGWGKRRSGATNIEANRLGLIQHSMDVARKPVQSTEKDPRPESLGIRSDCPGRRTVARSGLEPSTACLGAIPRPPCGADVYCASLPTVSPDTVVIPASGVFRAMEVELQMKHSSSLVSPHVAPCRHQPAHGERP